MKEEIKNVLLILTIGLTIIFIWLFFLSIAAIYHNEKINQNDNDVPNNFIVYWSCMDGCSNMEEILLGKLSYTNQTQKDYHDQCSKICADQYPLVGDAP